MAENRVNKVVQNVKYECTWQQNLQYSTVFCTSLAFLQYTVNWLKSWNGCVMQQKSTASESHDLAAQRVQNRLIGS